MELVLSTRNAHKLREFDALLAPHRLIPLPDDVELPPETGETFAENAIVKARTAAQATLSWLLGATAAISLIVGGIGIMNIMLVSVTERTREIGIAKALGAPRRFIMLQFLIEAMVLAAIGGLIGMIFGFALAYGVAAVIPGDFPPPAVPWWAVTGACLFSLLIGMVFGILPASKAANLTPIDALRYE